MRVGVPFIILVVSACSSKIKLISDLMLSQGCRVYFKASKEDAEAFVRDEYADLVIVDVDLPDVDVEAVCIKIKSIRELPVMLLASSNRDYVLHDQYRNAVDDFVVYPHMKNELIYKVKLYINYYQSKNRIYQLATTDFLTGCYNRRHFSEYLKNEINRNVRYGGGVTFVCLDIDGFRDFNQSYGLLYGDELLWRFSSIIIRQLRDVDHVGRLGGDEFGFLLPKTSPVGAELIVARLKETMAKGIGVKSAVVVATFSAAIIHVREFRESSVNFMITKASELLDKIRESGGDGFVSYTDV